MLPTHRLVEGDGVHYASLARAALGGDLAALANPYWSNLWPAVIAATSWLTRLDVVAAGRLAALVSGAALAPVGAALAERTFGRTTGLVAGLLIAGHPWLVHLSTLVLSESFVALLLMALLLAAQRTAIAGRSALTVGALGGLALMTRPESYATILAALLYVVARGAPRRLRRACGQAVLIAGVAACFLGARALLVRSAHGEWDFGIGVKGTANLLFGMAQSDSELERLRTEVTPEGARYLSKQIEAVTVLGFVRARPRVFLAHVVRNLKLLAACALRVLPPITPIPGRGAPWQVPWDPWLLAFAAGVGGLAVYGNVRGWIDPRARLEVALLSLSSLFFVAGLAAFIVHDRLVLTLVPLFLIFLAHGLVGSFAWLPGTRARELALAALSVSLALVSLGLLLRAPELDYSGERPVQREAGEWLKSHYAQTTRIMSPSPFVSYYFYDAENAANEVGLPWADEPGLVALARRRKVDLLIAPEWHLQAVLHPAAAPLRDPTCCLPDLRHVVTLGDGRAGRVFVYEVRPEAAATAEPGG